MGEGVVVAPKGNASVDGAAPPASGAVVVAVGGANEGKGLAPKMEEGPPPVPAGEKEGKLGTSPASMLAPAFSPPPPPKGSLPLFSAARTRSPRAPSPPVLSCQNKGLSLPLDTKNESPGSSSLLDPLPPVS